MFKKINNVSTTRSKSYALKFSPIIIRQLHSSILLQQATTQKKSPKSFDTPKPNIKYDSITDYQSYKSNNIYSHRLPESTAQQSPPLIALHSRLNLPKNYSLSTLSQALNLIEEEEGEGLVNNYSLNKLGTTLLNYFINEFYMINYPRLPSEIHNMACKSLIGVESLSSIGKSWGIEIDEITKLDRFLGQENEFMKYGRLRFNNNKENKVKIDGLTEVVDSRGRFKQEDFAYAYAVRSIIGGLYTHCGEESVKQFINDHILSRKVKLDSMFEFKKPSVELINLCNKLNFKEPVTIKLIAETGRLSHQPQFLAGVFVGNEKIGEGIGSSLKEAQTRSCVNSLLSYYLYSPINENGDQVNLPSDDKRTSYKFESLIDGGDV
ncbi:unnamed protein product [Candida verbasci]|uniref:DRBM domain-containing protein n=1 Tax=Candida verbasci TaxID=1227364 RepID=A0A9W4TU95_9ASCO|nr:unnamed protein product [Candida verbasci]